MKPDITEPARFLMDPKPIPQPPCVLNMGAFGNSEMYKDAYSLYLKAFEFYLIKYNSYLESI